jgi:hypothetical protein
MKQNSAYLLLYERKEPTVKVPKGLGVAGGQEGEWESKKVSAVGTGSGAISNMASVEEEEKEKEKERKADHREKKDRGKAGDRERGREKGSPFREDEKASEELKSLVDSEFLYPSGGNGIEKSYSSDSWDDLEGEKEAEKEIEKETKKDEDEKPVAKQHNTWNQDLSTWSGNGVGDFPPIAKKVLQAVWTENLEFQTDRSLFNR